MLINERRMNEIYNMFNLYDRFVKWFAMISKVNINLIRKHIFGEELNILKAKKTKRE